jgi:hypothetical protein
MKPPEVRRLEVRRKAIGTEVQVAAGIDGGGT